MIKYFITYNDYFGYCVIEENDGNTKIIFAGKIEDCNSKCIELNSSKQPKRSSMERPPWNDRPVLMMVDHRRKERYLI